MSQMSRMLQYSSRALKRYSFLKTDKTFIDAALHSRDVQFLPYHDFYPFCHKSDMSKLWKLKRTSDLHRPVVEAFLRSHKAPELVYMGLIPAKAADSAVFRYKDYEGSPLFAIDVTKHEYVIPQNEDIIKCQDFRHFNDLEVDESSLLSQGKMMLHWLATHKFCSLCGHENEVLACGGQLRCTNESCASHTRITNISFPRTDPVVIAAVTNVKRDRVLLCKQKIPALQEPERNLYACVSGFMDPSETIENAVLREVFEETGLDVLDVKYVATQPWPFTNNIMIGCMAVVDDAQPINLGHDDELIDARWFSIEEVKRILASDIDELGFLRDKVSGIRIPNDKTIANNLIAACVPI